jgi:hypothetical protein
VEKDWKFIVDDPYQFFPSYGGYAVWLLKSQYLLIRHLDEFSYLLDLCVTLADAFEPGTYSIPETKVGFPDGSWEVFISDQSKTLVIVCFDRREK